MNRISLFLLSLFAFISVGAANDNESFAKWGSSLKNGYGYYVRAGFVLGGACPMPMPEEIRSIDGYSVNGCFMFGLDGFKMIDDRWGLLTGARVSIQGMKTKAQVKNYHIGITKGDDYLTGYYTGTNKNNVSQTCITVPFEALYRVSPRWNLRLGPYLQYIFSNEFGGSVYDGYLRENTPTGAKVEITSESPATYEFDNDMRNLMWGFELGADWKAIKNMTVFGQLDMGVNGIFKKGFETISFTMYPVYLTLGLAYTY